MLKVAVPQLLIAGVYLLLRSVLLPLKSSVSGPAIVDHVQAVAESMGRFVTLTLAPHSLSVQQGLVETASGTPVHSMPYVVLGAIAFALFGALAIAMRRRHPAVTIAMAFYVFTLAPTLNVVYTNMLTLISERFLYLPLFGFALLVGWALAMWPRNRLLLAAVAVFTAFTALQSVRRSADFRDEDAFWARELELHPESAEARRARIRKLIHERRYRPALAETLELTRTASDYQDVKVALDMAQLLSDLTPDRDRESLEAIDTFAQELLSPTSESARLATRGVTFAIPTTTKVFRQFRDQQRLRIIMLRANVRSRLGDDSGAVSLVKEALAACSRCGNIVAPGALVLARAGFYDDAYALLDSARGYVAEAPLRAIRSMIDTAADASRPSPTASEPMRLQARALELAALELWGRAYEVLAPYKEEIKHASGFATGFAELAFRAGSPDIAREVLTIRMSSLEIEQLFAQWSAKMGWGD